MPKSRNAKRKYEAAAAAAASSGAAGDAADDGALDSPGISISLGSSKGMGTNGGNGGTAGTTGRLVSKSSASRSGSMTGMRDSPVRMADDGTESADGSKRMLSHLLSLAVSLARLIEAQ